MSDELTKPKRRGDQQKSAAKPGGAAVANRHYRQDHTPEDRK